MRAKARTALPVQLTYDERQLIKQAAAERGLSASKFAHEAIMRALDGDTESKGSNERTGDARVI